MLRRGRYIAVAAVLGAGLVAIALIPGETRSTASSASDVHLAMTSASSPNPDLLRRINAAVAPPPIVKADPRAQDDDNEAASVQTVSLTTGTDLAATAVAPAPETTLKPDTIGGSAVNLRAGPSSGSQQLSVLQPGEAVQTGQTSGGWIEVTRADGSKGWIYGSYLSSNVAAPIAKAQVAKAPVAKPSAPSSQVRATIQGDDGDLEDRTARIASRLTAYSHPGDSAEAVMTFAPGTRVRIAEVRGNWLRVEAGDGTSAWIKR
jgi:SH3-like domain-containing protein